MPCLKMSDFLLYFGHMQDEYLLVEGISTVVGLYFLGITGQKYGDISELKTLSRVCFFFFRFLLFISLVILGVFSACLYRVEIGDNIVGKWLSYRDSIIAHTFLILDLILILRIFFRLDILEEI